MYKGTVADTAVPRIPKLIQFRNSRNSVALTRGKHPKAELELRSRLSPPAFGPAGRREFQGRRDPELQGRPDSELKRRLDSEPERRLDSEQ